MDGWGKVGVVLVAAGSGTRFGGKPKQYRRIGRDTILRRSALAARAGRSDWPIAVVHAPDREADARAALGDLPNLRFVPGADNRQGSVRAGLEALSVEGLDAVLIHDGARPFVAPAVVAAALDALKTTPGAIPGLPVVDSLRRINGDGEIAESVSRDALIRAQTPQAFRFPDILEAHRAASDGHTDDASVAAAHGLTVAATPGDPENVKITHGDDLIAANAKVARTGAVETRIGKGFDVHRFGPGTAARLCGVDVPHDAALMGHSDADVAWHALTDALLGAIGEGDIGSWFPPTDPQWKGADSEIFLAAAVDRVAERGGRIVNVDLTIICERPKVGPHRAAMRMRTAQVLGLSEARINVKGTTTEELGFTGRREGVASEAAVLIELPAVD